MMPSDLLCHYLKMAREVGMFYNFCVHGQKKTYDLK